VTVSSLSCISQFTRLISNFGSTAIVLASTTTLDAVSPSSGKLLWSHEVDSNQKLDRRRTLLCENGASPFLVSVVGEAHRFEMSNGESVGSFNVPSVLHFTPDRVTSPKTDAALPFTSSNALPLDYNADHLDTLIFEANKASLVEVNAQDGSTTVRASAKVTSATPFPHESGAILKSVGGDRSTYIWLDGSHLRTFECSMTGTFGKQSSIHGSYIKLIDLGLDSLGVRLAQRNDGSSTLLQLLSNGDLEQVWQYPAGVSSL